MPYASTREPSEVKVGLFAQFVESIDDLKAGQSPDRHEFITILRGLRSELIGDYGTKGSVAGREVPVDV